MCTKEAVSNLRTQYEVKLFNQWADILGEEDILHIFNPGSFPVDAYNLANYAKKKGTKIVLSPITFHSPHVVLQQMGWATNLMDSIVGAFRRPLRWPFLRFMDPLRYMESVIRMADLVLPNTTDELEGLVSRFGVERKKCRIVPNGVEQRFMHGSPETFRRKTGLSDFILYVGKIDERKNVLSLIQAHQRFCPNNTLVIVGEPTSQGYMGKCKQAAGNNVVFIPSILHDDPLLMSAYAAARVVILPSFYETPGLSALEGGLAGANVVITSVGGTRDYFANLAWYVDPCNVEDIGKKMAIAFRTPRSNKLQAHIASRYTWSAVGKATVNAYDELMLK